MTKDTSLLAADLKIEPSQLYVKNLQKLTRYYKDIIGLEVLVSTPNSSVLGHGQVPVLELVGKPEYSAAPAGSAGLFHNAILYDSKAELARTLYNVLTKMPEVYEGPGDHLVSQAFYFHDPEYNGLELYVDRPRDAWVWSNGMVKMTTEYIDVTKFIMENINDEPTPTKQIGHVHLKVGDIPAARRFYVNQLGFDITANLETALFVSVGGYHHHIGMNTWQSQGAGKRDPSLGLGEVKVVLPPDGNIDRLAERLQSNKTDFEDTASGLIVRDPWANIFEFTT